MKGKGPNPGMVLKLASEEVQEVHQAVSAAYQQLLEELSRVSNYRNHTEGLELCRRKWKLEALLHRLDQRGEPFPVLEVLPAGRLEPSHSEAA